LLNDRWIHVLIVSGDWEWAGHFHPDDFKDMTVNNTNEVFFIKTTFPRSGLWVLAFSFIYNDHVLGVWREGFTETNVYVDGTPDQNANPTFNYTATNRFESYPVNDTDIFDDFVWVDTNLDSTGFVAVLSVDGQLVPSNGSVNVNVIQGLCTAINIDFYKNDTSGMTPVNLIPYLAAPVHFTISNRDNAVYHAHGTYLLDTMDMSDVVTMMDGMTMDQMMTLSPEMLNLSMNAMMIGVESNGSVNCKSDEGKIMQEMQGMMDMSMFYGPSTFYRISGLFDFPDLAHFRIFAYVKVRLDDGTERLLVPSFAVYSVADPMSSQASSSSILSIATATLLLLLALAF